MLPGTASLRILCVAEGLVRLRHVLPNGAHNANQDVKLSITQDTYATGFQKVQIAVGSNRAIELE